MTDTPLSRWRVAMFALPSIPISALGLPIVVYLPPFYAEEMGLSLTLVGTIFMIARFWDIFTDPILGVLSDRFPSRWGRRLLPSLFFPPSCFSCPASRSRACGCSAGWAI